MDPGHQDDATSWLANLEVTRAGALQTTGESPVGWSPKTTSSDQKVRMDSDGGGFVVGKMEFFTKIIGRNEQMDSLKPGS